MPQLVAVLQFVQENIIWISTIIVLLIGLWQYGRAQRWQRADVLLSLIDSFEKNERIQSACSMLDWDEREVTVGRGKTIRFENELLVRALRVPYFDRQKRADEAGRKDEIFTPEEREIRDAFDAFFDFFDKLHAFLKAGLLSFQEDCTYFYYWLELIRDIEHYKASKEIKKALYEYIEAYRFSGVKEMLAEYSENPQPLRIKLW
jgi:hypothetical protein